MKYAYDKYIAPYPDLRDKLYLVYEGTRSSLPVNGVLFTDIMQCRVTSMCAGKPLITVFDGDSLHEHLQPLNASNFTVRLVECVACYDACVRLLKRLSVVGGCPHSCSTLTRTRMG